METNYKNERLLSTLRKEVALFLTRRSGRGSLISVTHLEIDKNLEHGLIYVSVLPESAEKKALEFVNRQIEEMVEYLGERIKMRRIPHFRFVIDEGMKNFNQVSEVLIKERKKS